MTTLSGKTNHVKWAYTLDASSWNGVEHLHYSFQKSRLFSPSLPPSFLSPLAKTDGKSLVEIAAATDCQVHTSAFVIKVNGTGCCRATWGRLERAALLASFHQNHAGCWWRAAAAPSSPRLPRASARVVMAAMLTWTWGLVKVDPSLVVKPLPEALQWGRASFHPDVYSKFHMRNHLEHNKDQHSRLNSSFASFFL